MKTIINIKIGGVYLLVQEGDYFWEIVFRTWIIVFPWGFIFG